MGFASSFSGYGGGYGTDSGQSFSVPSAPDAPSVDTPSNVDSFDMGGGQTISIDPAGNVTQDGVGYSPSIPGTDLSLEPTVAGMLAYQDLARAAQQQAALEQYEMAQVLAPEFEAGLLDEQARGTTTEPAVAPPTFIQQQTSKAKDVLSDYFLVKDAEGNLMPVQTGLNLVGKATGPMGMLGTGVARAFYDMLTFDRGPAIEAELQAEAEASGLPPISDKDMPAAMEGYYQGEHAENQARGEADISPSMPQRLLSQGQQDPAAGQQDPAALPASALFGPTHIYGALPGQRQRRGAYQYIPPTFGPIRS